MHGVVGPPREIWRRLAALLILLLTLLANNTAQADSLSTQAPVRIVLLHEGTDPFLVSLHQELEAAGFDVEDSATDKDTSLAAVAQSHEAQGVLRPTEDGKGVEVWIDSSRSGRPLLRHLVVDEETTPPNQELVVLQTVELLRTAFQPPTPRDEQPPPAPPPTEVKPAPSRPSPWVLRVGPGIQVESAGSPTLHLLLGAAGPLTDNLRAELTGEFPLSNRELVEGAARIRWATTIARLGVRWSTTSPPATGLSAAFGGGLSLQWLHFKGEAPPPQVGERDLVFLPGGYLMAAARYGLAERLSVWLEGTMDATPTSVKIVASDETIAHRGRLSGVAAVLTEWAF